MTGKMIWGCCAAENGYIVSFPLTRAAAQLRIVETHDAVTPGPCSTLGS